MTDRIVVLSTCGSAEEASRIARAMVEGRLAACVNIIAPVHSIYRWQGEIEEQAEWLLLIKTRRELVADLGQELRRLHSYEVPELIALPIVDGLDAYLRWIAVETGGGDGND